MSETTTLTEASELPLKFCNRVKNFYPENSDAIMAGFSVERKGSFRINTLTSSQAEVLQEFLEKEIEISEYSYFSPEISDNFSVYTFDRKFEYAIKGTQAFYEGKIYLQSLASMVPVFALQPKRRQNILDVCAAPGSKTTQIAAITENNAIITALEKNQIRHQRLEYNIALQGAEKSIETHKIDALKYLKDETSIRATTDFDAILLDAPCSAEGRISLSQEKSYGFWKMQNILDKAQLQYNLLAASFGKLKKGGVLVYSTCTLAPEENEGVVSRILEDFPEISLVSLPHIFASDEALEYITPALTLYDSEEVKISEKTLKILPSEYTEGFFVAKFLKK